jgi:hypothetical protein
VWTDPKLLSIKILDWRFRKFSSVWKFIGDWLIEYWLHVHSSLETRTKFKDSNWVLALILNYLISIREQKNITQHSLQWVTESAFSRRRKREDTDGQTDRQTDMTSTIAPSFHKWENALKTLTIKLEKKSLTFAAENRWSILSRAWTMEFVGTILFAHWPGEYFLKEAVDDLEPEGWR